MRYAGAIFHYLSLTIMQALFIPKETREFEERVALIPKDIQQLQKDFQIFVQEDAGLSAGYRNEEYQEHGASICTLEEGLEKAQVIVFVAGPKNIEQWKLKEHQLLIGLMNLYTQSHWVDYFKEHQCSSLSLEMIPRITRAQSMDILSSQSNLAGYKAALVAIEQFKSVVPMLMTAAGSISPAKFLIIGAGVAGLQAIATAKRMGARVSAFDVRPAAKEQVESLGATFIEVESQEDLETSGGYAKETSEDYKRRQQELLNQELSKVDVVITTALIPGRQAPILLTQEQVELMKEGSLVVDMAISMGGNCSLTEYGKNIDHQGVKILGHPNLASLVAKDSSKFFSKNIFNLLKHLTSVEFEEWKTDPILQPCLLQIQGQNVHESLKAEVKEPAVQEQKIQA